MKIRCSNEHLIFIKIGVWQNVEGSQINKNCISIVFYVCYYIFWIKLPGFFVYYPYNSLVQYNVPYLQTYFKFIFCITETYFWPCFSSPPPCQQSGILAWLYLFAETKRSIQQQGQVRSEGFKVRTLSRELMHWDGMSADAVLIKELTPYPE